MAISSHLTTRTFFLLLFPLLTALLAGQWPAISENPRVKSWKEYFRPKNTLDEFVCDPTHRYTTHIVSVDPLVIYIEGFVSGEEARRVVEEGTPSLTPSLLQNPSTGHLFPDPTRTSRSSPLTLTPALTCILSRAHSFLGPTLPLGGDFGTPQIVSYRPGEKFGLHRDWYETPQRLRDGRVWNRLGSFFVTLEVEGVRGGETWFPRLDGGEMGGGEGGGVREEEEDRGNRGEEKEGRKEEVTRQLWRKHEDGGIAFRPVVGNAIFWMNLLRNGTGDERVVHAGLAVEDGRKTAMNIWPRRFF